MHAHSALCSAHVPEILGALNAFMIMAMAEDCEDYEAEDVPLD